MPAPATAPAQVPKRCLAAAASREAESFPCILAVTASIVFGVTRLAVSSTFGLPSTG
jgi:hypothetical protein